jgi:Transposase DDE domain
MLFSNALDYIYRLTVFIGPRASSGNRAPPFWTVSSSRRRKKAALRDDAGTNIRGRKCHTLAVTRRLLSAVVITAANVEEQNIAKRLLEGIAQPCSRLQCIWADGGMPVSRSHGSGDRDVHHDVSKHVPVAWSG